MWHCLIIEDDRENARYIANGLIEMGHVAVVCHDGVEALQNAMKLSWDVIILDRMLPNNIDGLSILQTLRSLGKKMPVLVLSALAAVDDRVNGFKAGGDDYLVKPFAFSELIARLEALIKRTRADDQLRELRVADLTANLATRKVERSGLAIALQPREFRLLIYLLMNAGSVVTRTMLLEAVWDYRFDPQSNVIDVQVSRLRRKIDNGFASALIHTVRGAGYMLTDKGATDTNVLIPA
ncbi:response regulator transcription factor [Alcaligenaceae bacterium]|nr:response regulator transcription factor [Alcaligenaceae bacterium]